ncbi:MAG TPA: SIS domain-containing protein [Vicinamibacteria bacterium]|jgi:glucosamine--fructose-6-phosphate aminotransferase (isomerizing)|nr:SIS domain-containing protein [Vicinamibacteria bacterium]
MTTRFEAEVREQPVVLGRLLSEGREGAEAIAAKVRGYAPRFAVLAARGTSDNAAHYGQYLLGIQNRLVAALATPSLFTHYDATPSLAGAFVIGISQSGQSPDIVEVVRAARGQGAVTLAITNDVRSPLASAAELVLPLLAGKEEAVAATKTYTAQLMALAMVSAALRAEETAWEELGKIPELVARSIDLGLPFIPLAARFREQTRLVVVGRGYNLSTALEIALKIKETSAIMADGYSSADFLHGPMAILDQSLPVMVVAPGTRTFEELEGVVGLAKERGARLLAISDRRSLLEAAEIGMPLPPDIPEWLSPLVAVVPGQIWALGLSLARGMHPDAPRGLSKVTRTR